MKSSPRVIYLTLICLVAGRWRVVRGSEVLRSMMVGGLIAGRSAVLRFVGVLNTPRHRLTPFKTNKHLFILKRDMHIVEVINYIF